jgi:hypothetical protein
MKSAYLQSFTWFEQSLTRKGLNSPAIVGGYLYFSEPYSFAEVPRVLYSLDCPRSRQLLRHSFGSKIFHIMHTKSEILIGLTTVII